LAAFLLLAIGIALVGCGGGDSTTTEGAEAAQESAPPQPDAGVGGDSGRQTANSNPGAGGDSHRQRHHGRNGAEQLAKGDGDRKSGGNGNGSGSASGRSGRCPKNITREQCRAYAEQPVSDGPSYVAGEPADCAKTMSREACKEQFEEERAAQETAGPSVDVEHCLEERTRAQCEAQVATQLEAERAAAKGE
jgi:hypothetical protein